MPDSKIRATQFRAINKDFEYRETAVITKIDD
jgi:hypothetical protein